jgi:hypothetical protein
VSSLVDEGITWLAERAGAPAPIAGRALDLGKQHAERILRWVGAD